ncbi:MAG: MarR family winged helix-turn-helix transcriptional regulator [Planctomycetaceae bacterium]
MDDPLRQCVGLRLGAVYRRVDRIFNRAYAELGVSHAHAQILLCIRIEGEMRAADLSARTGLESSTVSRLVSELCRRKLVKRRPAPADRRSHIISTATRTDRFCERLLEQHRRINARLRREMPDADLEALLRMADLLDRLP